ncbi:uncharacterized protein LOC135928355 isoform X2 [Gordionus sp. m RMFG-2023]|uniref:uncharacterized protein LOC135928355 isoform X2 n=1 Tax=Gordionus sp. m RMFG-2023 TaxID=3053472 RepID=UPI0031FD5E66
MDMESVNDESDEVSNKRYNKFHGVIDEDKNIISDKAEILRSLGIGLDDFMDDKDESFNMKFLFLISPFEDPYDMEEDNECSNILSNYQLMSIDSLSSNKYHSEPTDVNLLEYFNQKPYEENTFEDGEIEDDFNSLRKRSNKRIANAKDETVLLSHKWRKFIYPPYESEIETQPKYPLLLFRFAKNIEIRLGNFNKRLDLRQILAINSKKNKYVNQTYPEEFKNLAPSYNSDVPQTSNGRHLITYNDIEEESNTLDSRTSAMKSKKDKSPIIDDLEKEVPFDYESEILLMYDKMTSNQLHQNTLQPKLGKGIFTKTFKNRLLQDNRRDKNTITMVADMIHDSETVRIRTRPVKRQEDDSDDQTSFKKSLEMHRKGKNKRHLLIDSAYSSKMPNFDDIIIHDENDVRHVIRKKRNTCK